MSRKKRATSRCRIRPPVSASACRQGTAPLLMWHSYGTWSGACPDRSPVHCLGISRGLDFSRSPSHSPPCALRRVHLSGGSHVWRICSLQSRIADLMLGCASHRSEVRTGGVQFRRAYNDHPPLTPGLFVFLGTPPRPHLNVEGVVPDFVPRCRIEMLDETPSRRQPLTRGCCRR